MHEVENFRRENKSFVLSITLSCIDAEVVIIFLSNGFCKTTDRTVECLVLSQQPTICIFPNCWFWIGLIELYDSDIQKFTFTPHGRVVSKCCSAFRIVKLGITSSM